MLGSVFNQSRRASGLPPVSSILRHFIIKKELHGFSEFQGTGPPELDYGLPGDIYLDLSPGNLTLYARHPNAWKAWRGPDDTRNLIYHPECPDRCLWCVGDAYGWYAARRSHASQGKTQSEVLAAARERASTKSTESGKKRKRDAQEEEQNKRVQVSNSTTPPPTSTTHIATPSQRRPSNSHEAPKISPSSLQRNSLNQLQSPRGSNAAGPSSSHRNLNQIHSPRASGSSLTGSKTATQHPTTEPHTGSSSRAAAAAGPSRILSADLRESPPADDAEEVDELEEIDQLVDTDLDPEIQEIAPPDPPPAPNAGPRYRTPSLEAAISHLSMPHNTNMAEEHYSSTAIASYIKPVLQELARLRQAESARDANQAEAQATLQAEVDRLQASETLRMKEIEMITKSLLDEKTSARANAVLLARAQGELVSLKEAARRDAERIHEANDDRAKLKRAAELDATRIEQRSREVAALQESTRLDSARIEEAKRELIQLKRAAQLDAARIREGNEEIEALKWTAGIKSKALQDVRDEVVLLKSNSVSAASRLEHANKEIGSLRATAEVNAQRVRALEDENASLKVVGELYVQAKNAIEKLDETSKEKAALLSAAEAEITRLKKENAELQNLPVSASVNHPPGNGGNPMRTREPSRDSMAKATSEQMGQKNSHLSPVRTTVDAPPPGSDLMELLQDIHVNTLCADMDDFFLCRSCLCNSATATQHEFKKGAQIKDSFLDIHVHHMQKHHEDYEIILSLPREELLDMQRQMVQGDSQPHT